MLHSYSSPLALGHKLLAELFDGPVIVQEKVDGSQFSFGVDEAGQLSCRSRGQEIDLEAPGMFALGVAMAKDLAQAGRLWMCHTYRGEFLAKPKHNTLAYSRVPRRNVILFDIDQGDQDYLDPARVRAHAQLLGLEYVPTWTLTNPTMEALKALTEVESILGGVQREGVVVKNYAKFGRDHKVLMGKLVRPEFKEVHSKDWRKRNPGNTDFVTELGASVGTTARWRKAVQHLMEAGVLVNAPQDIPALMREVSEDILSDRDHMAAELFKHFQRDLQKAATRGLPEWYKAELEGGHGPDGVAGPGSDAGADRALGDAPGGDGGAPDRDSGVRQPGAVHPDPVHDA